MVVLDINIILLSLLRKIYHKNVILSFYIKVINVNIISANNPKSIYSLFQAKKGRNMEFM